MNKKRSRRIKYATYKSLIPECKAYDYDPDTKTIMVDLPDEVIENVEFVPDGWSSKFSTGTGDFFTFISAYSKDPETSYIYNRVEIYKRTRDGIAIYECKTFSHDKRHPHGVRHDKNFLNYGMAVAWCNEMLI